VAGNYEPIAWAEELIEAAKAVGHPQLATLWVIASLSSMAGRIESAVRCADAALEFLDDDGATVAFGMQGWLNGTYINIGQHARAVELCRTHLARGHDTLMYTRSALAMALTIEGATDEANALAEAMCRGL
jgi:hypothetical protein